MRLKQVLSGGVALCALLAGANGAIAGDFTVPSGDTVGAQVLTDPGDVGLIEDGGAISTIDDNELGVSMENANQTVTNDGDVTTLGTSAFGISSQGADARINNNGDITTSGFAADGIFSEGADARIDNSGNITTSNGSADGITTGGENAQINNSGAITTSDVTSRGIVSSGGYVQITNTGDITTSGSSSYGIVSSGTNAQINNSGDIVTSGLNGFGIHSHGEDAQIANSGNIATSGTNGYGIYSRATATNAQIDNSGNITTSGTNGYGIYSLGEDVQIDNSGDVTTSGESSYGVYSIGTNARIDNSGAITTSSFFSDGIQSTGAGAQIDNSGAITTLGGGSRGIMSTAADARIDNSGNITTSGQSARGIVVTGPDAHINNSGNITTSGASAFGILSNGSDSQIHNSGNISTSLGDGIVSLADGAHIYNSGNITTSGAIASGIYAGNATVTNSGRIISEQYYAMRFVTPGATLNLLAGSALQGGIQFSNPDAAILNIGPGLNTALTFEGLPTVINSNGAPMAIQGSLVAVVDPTGFSAQDEMLTDLTRAIANAVDGRLNAARFGYVPMTGSMTAYVEPETHSVALGYGTGGETGASHGSGFWAAGIGAWRDQDADGADVGFDTALGGLLIGYDAEVSAGTRVGAFLGASTSRFETDANSQEIDADSYFGGVYGSYSAQNYFLDASLTGGVSQQSSDRTVANNLVIGGIEHAEADYDGVFVSPSATVGTIYAMGGGMLIPSLRARYAGLFLDGYEESGSAADMTVDDRDVNVFDFRAQLAYALAARPLNGGMLQTAVRFGADATFADNDDVQAVLLGTGLNFSVNGDDTVRGFAGVDLSWQADGGASFFLGGEAGYDSGDAVTFDVRGGLRIPM